MLIRNWRNSKHVSQFMEFQEQISETQQIEWFLTLEQEQNYYFTVHHEEEPIGLIHLNQFNSKDLSAFAGLFIGKEEFEGTGAAFAASIQLLDFAFDELQLQCVYAKVHQSNQVALNYNEHLGFKYEKRLDKNFICLSVNVTSYQEHKEKLSPLLLL